MGGVLATLFGGGHRRRAPTTTTRQPSTYGNRRAVLSKKYSFIPDTYKSLEEVLQLAFSSPLFN
jgi:E3 ubiquitin-protein ligase RGLG